MKLVNMQMGNAKCGVIESAQHVMRGCGRYGKEIRRLKAAAADSISSVSSGKSA